jgi:hypothetical protein
VEDVLKEAEDQAEEAIVVMAEDEMEDLTDVQVLIAVKEEVLIDQTGLIDRREVLVLEDEETNSLRLE